MKIAFVCITLIALASENELYKSLSFSRSFYLSFFRIFMIFSILFGFYRDQRTYWSDRYFFRHKQKKTIRKDEKIISFFLRKITYYLIQNNKYTILVSWYRWWSRMLYKSVYRRWVMNCYVPYHVC